MTWKIEIPGFDTLEDALVFRAAHLLNRGAVIVSDPPLAGAPVSDDVAMLLAGLNVGSLAELHALIERGRDPFTGPGEGPALVTRSLYGILAEPKGERDVG